MTLKALGMFLGAALMINAGQITFTASSAFSGSTAGNITFDNVGPSPGGGGGLNCVPAGSCSFFYTNDAAGYLFQIGTQTGDPGLVGLLGGIGVLTGGGTIDASGVFEANNIVTDASGDQSATVTIPAGTQFIINDGGGTAASDFFTASISTLDLMSTNTALGLNLQGIVNLSGLAYTGSNTALQALAAQPGGILKETFTLTGLANDLTQLFDTANNGLNSNIQLSVATVPEPRFYGALLCGLMALVGFVVRRRNRATA